MLTSVSLRHDGRPIHHYGGSSEPSTATVFGPTGAATTVTLGEQGQQQPPDPQQTPSTEVPVEDRLKAAETDLEKWKKQARTNEDRAKANAAAAQELEKIKAANQTDTERLSGQVEKLTRTIGENEAKIVELTAELARRSAMVKYGLSEEDAVFIPAGSAEEMDEAAKKLADRIGNGKVPSFDGGARTSQSPPATDMDEMIRRARRR